MGLSECDNMLLLLGVCREMDKEEQKIVTRKMIEGFNGNMLFDWEIGETGHT